MSLKEAFASLVKTLVSGPASIEAEKVLPFLLLLAGAAIIVLVWHYLNHNKGS